MLESLVALAITLRFLASCATLGRTSGAWATAPCFCNPENPCGGPSKIGLWAAVHSELAFAERGVVVYRVRR